jgi:hypothetical protein
MSWREEGDWTRPPKVRRPRPTGDELRAQAVRDHWTPEFLAETLEASRQSDVHDRQVAEQLERDARAFWAAENGTTEVI